TVCLTVAHELLENQSGEEVLFDPLLHSGLVPLILQKRIRRKELSLHNTQSLQLQGRSGLGDCSEVFQDGNVASGLYVIRPDGSPTALSVFCDMNNGGGWTVFQRRRDGKESFDRCIDMEDFKGNHRFAKYRNFRVDDEQDQYQLHVGEYTGTGDDALSDALNPNSPCSGGIKFSTFDHPNYINAGDDKGRCIRHSKSGWWFCRCDSGNLNGRYYKGPFEAMSDDGVTWYLWHGWSYAIKSVVMMLRAADLENPPPIIARWPGQFHTVAVTEGTNHAPYGQ
uniref:Fibrinogen-like protein 1 n=1 Tax=Oryzias melastigma TaxID=30732 RepID=A0A3B3DFD7_ORYME